MPTRRYLMPPSTAASMYKSQQTPSIYMSVNNEMHDVNGPTAGLRSLPYYTAPIVDRPSEDEILMPSHAVSNQMEPSMGGEQGPRVTVVRKSEPFRYEIPLAAINKVWSCVLYIDLGSS